MAGFLERLFGPSKEAVWRALAEKLGASYVDAGFFADDKVQLTVGDCILTLDTYTVSTGKSSVTFTRMRAPYVNRDGLRFTVYRRGFFTELGVKLGMVQDLEVGFEPFDTDFVVQGSDPRRVAELLSGQRLRELIAAQPQIRLTVKDDEGLFGGRFPNGVDMLSFEVVGVIKNIALLEHLFMLFAEALHRLGHLDSGHEDDVALHLETLSGPGGKIMRGEVVLWDGDAARVKAARALGELKPPAAVRPLIGVLRDDDAALRATAAWALGELGSADAARPLIPLLGDAAGEAAGQALRKLGRGEPMDAWNAVLAGDPAAIERLKGTYQDQVAQALTSLLPAVRQAELVAAATALVELAGLGALPALRERLRGGDVRRSDAPDAVSLRGLVEKLEGLSSLPQAAATPEPDTSALPRAADPSIDA